MLLVLDAAPVGQVIVRSDAVMLLEPAFAWSPTISARVLRLANGQQTISLDTAANVAAVTHALAGSGASVQPAPPAAPATTAPANPSERT